MLSEKETKDEYKALIKEYKRVVGENETLSGRSLDDLEVYLMKLHDLRCSISILEFVLATKPNKCFGKSP